jgi:hypothetical protein
VSTPNYLIAHRAVPIQAGSRPEGLWNDLSGPEWSSWLAMVGMKLEIKVRHIGIEGMALGNPVIARDGFEMIAMYFPTPEASGEPYFAVTARRAGETKLRSFVFERGSTTPEEPVRVVMAEWRYQGPDNVMRIRMDVTADASLEACIVRTLDVMKEVHPEAPASASPAPKPPLNFDIKDGASSTNFIIAVIVAIVAIVGLVLWRM